MLQERALGSCYTRKGMGGRKTPKRGQKTGGSLFFSSNLQQLLQRSQTRRLTFVPKTRG